jgi:hypothetical protein
MFAVLGNTADRVPLPVPVLDLTTRTVRHRKIFLILTVCTTWQVHACEIFSSIVTPDVFLFIKRYMFGSIIFCISLSQNMFSFSSLYLNEQINIRCIGTVFWSVSLSDQDSH